LNFNQAPFAARLNADGQMVLLGDQDRRQWDQGLIARGFAHLTRSAVGGEVSEYHLEAAIASYHAQAESLEKTRYAYERALQLAALPREKQVLSEKIAKLLR